MTTRLIKHEDHFDRAQSFTTTPGENGWTIKVTGGGTPTHAIATNGGGGTLTLSNTSEAQVVPLYHKDILTIPIASLQNICFDVCVTGVDAVTQIAFGIGSAQNDTLNSVATNAWFRIDGTVSTSTVYCETDDGTTDTDDQSTGTTLSSTTKRFVIDFTNGLADVRFYIDGERVCKGTTFTMAAVAAGTFVQPYVQVQKASGTGVPAVSIKYHSRQHTFDV